MRTNNRTENHTYGSSVVLKSLPKSLVTDGMVMRKYTSESEFYFFFVHGPRMQLWINAGNKATLLEWMVGGWVGGWVAGLW